MEIHIRRLLYSKYSHVLISIILGFGLATIFRKVCKKRNCIVFNAPSLKDIDEKVYKFNDKCYKYSYNNVSCNKNKKKVPFA